MVQGGPVVGVILQVNNRIRLLTTLRLSHTDWHRWGRRVPKERRQQGEGRGEGPPQPLPRPRGKGRIGNRLETPMGGGILDGLNSYEMISGGEIV